jgi:lipopolysaccharide/colanic/teichoic acid biosynthesis glycosyltransferase
LREGLNTGQKLIKRFFDLFFSFIGFIVLLLPLLVLIVLSTISTKKCGLYSQVRIGFLGKPFVMYKIRTMVEGEDSQLVTVEDDPRITRFGRLLRKFKLDELPQLWNVIKGDMSLVGPRPDVPGYADQLKGEDRIILSVKPGITGPATVKYKNEESLLAEQKDPVAYNNEVIWKDKIEINKRYIKNWSLKEDVLLLFRTFFS